MASVDDSHDSDSEEEALVVIDFKGIGDTGWLNKVENKCKIWGAATDKPIVQLGRYVFSGEYKDKLGTSVMLQKSKSKEQSLSDETGNEKEELKYMYKAQKSLMLSRTFPTKKDAVTGFADPNESQASGQASGSTADEGKEQENIGEVEEMNTT